MDSPTIQIGDAEIPLYGKDGLTWALLNLILAIAGGVLAIVLFVSYFIGKKEEEEEHGPAEQTTRADSKPKKKILGRILAGVVAILSVVLFILTQNIRLPISLFDNWTLLTAVLLGVEIVFAVLSKTKKEKDDPEEEDMQSVHAQS